MCWEPHQLIRVLNTTDMKRFFGSTFGTIPLFLRTRLNEAQPTVVSNDSWGWRAWIDSQRVICSGPEKRQSKKITLGVHLHKPSIEPSKPIV